MTSSNPIQELENAIASAQGIPAQEAESTLALDPLNSLKFRIQQAHPAVAHEPIWSIFQAIEADQVLESTPYQSPHDPLEALRSLIRGEEPEPANDNETAQAVPESAPPMGFEGLLGDEVMQILATRPLSPESRVEAVRRALMMIQNPSAENARAVLSALLSE